MKEHPSWIRTVEHGKIAAMMRNPKKFKSWVVSSIQLFRAFHGEPTVKNLRTSLFWKSTARYMSGREQSDFIDLWLYQISVVVPPRSYPEWVNKAREEYARASQ